MKKWYEIMYEIAEGNPGVRFEFLFVCDPGGNPIETVPPIISVEFSDGSQGSIHQTSGGDWTFGG